MSKSATETTWWKIGPERARELLESNAVNRKLRPLRVASYAEDMRQDLWLDVGDTIKMSRTGQLLDGQHRLFAVIEADTTLEFRVITGLDDRAQSLMDQGAARTANDALKLEGFSNTTLMSGVARWVLLVGEPGPHASSALKHKASTARIVKVAKEQPDIGEAATKYAAFQNYVTGSPTAICYSWLWMHRADSTACDTFWTGIVDLNFRKPDDARKAVIRALARLNRDEGVAAGSQEKQIATISVLTRGWNLWRKGEGVNTIALRDRTKKLIPAEKPI